MKVRSAPIHSGHFMKNWALVLVKVLSDTCAKYSKKYDMVVTPSYRAKYIRGWHPWELTQVRVAKLGSFWFFVYFISL